MNSILDVEVTTVRLTCNFLQIFYELSRAMTSYFYSNVFWGGCQGKNLNSSFMKRIIWDTYGKLEQYRIMVKKNVLH